MAEKIDDLNFEDKVLKADKPVLVDFWAVWCPPCRQMNPVIEEIAQEVEGKAYVYKLNIDENPSIGAKYSITSIPTFGFFKDGELINLSIGGQPKKALLEPLKKLMDS